jgi:uncharacterized protein
VILYCDTSSLVKLYVDESGTETVRALVAGAAVVATSAVAYVEMRATFARFVREARAKRVDVAAKAREFEADWVTTTVIRADDELLRTAGSLAERHRLRALDAIHLASFVQVLERAGEEDVTFSTFDDRLARAARRIG